MRIQRCVNVKPGQGILTVTERELGFISQALLVYRNKGHWSNEGYEEITKLRDKVKSRRKEVAGGHCATGYWECLDDNMRED